MNAAERFDGYLKHLSAGLVTWTATPASVVTPWPAAPLGAQARGVDGRAGKSDARERAPLVTPPLRGQGRVV